MEVLNRIKGLRHCIVHESSSPALAGCQISSSAGYRHLLHRQRNLLKIVSYAASAGQSLGTCHPTSLLAAAASFAHIHTRNKFLQACLLLQAACCAVARAPAGFGELMAESGSLVDLNPGVRCPRLMLVLAQICCSSMQVA